jgi:hypothetical protein
VLEGVWDQQLGKGEESKFGSGQADFKALRYIEKEIIKK